MRKGNCKDHHVPLARQVVALSRELQEFFGAGKFIFLGARAKTDTISDTEPLNVLRDLGYPKEVMPLHGCRSMASSRLNEMGYRPDIIETQLVHKDPDAVRMVYNRAQYMDERRKMMEEWADYLDRLRFASDSAEAETQADETEDIFREMDTDIAIGKIDEHSQITEKDTGWSEAYREKLRAAGYDGMDILQAWYG